MWEVVGLFCSEMGLVDVFVMLWSWFVSIVDFVMIVEYEDVNFLLFVYVVVMVVLIRMLFLGVYYWVDVLVFDNVYVCFFVLILEFV